MQCISRGVEKYNKKSYKDRHPGTIFLIFNICKYNIYFLLSYLIIAAVIESITRTFPTAEP